MPKTEIDYSNTIIYKITCKDPNVTDIYVGYTTNFIQRKHTHKQSCTNIKSTNYKCKLYEVIRNNGGWNNWQMEIINIFNCADHYEARKKEQEYFISLNATLNSIEPFPKPKIIPTKNTIIYISKQVFECNICNIKCANSQLLEFHNKTKKHIKLSQPGTNSHKKIAKKFTCEYCDMKTNNKKDYTRHCLTLKHKNRMDSKNLESKKPLMYVCSVCMYISQRELIIWVCLIICVWVCLV